MKSLIDCPENITLVLLKIDIQDTIVFNRLFALGLYPGSKFRIISKKNIYVLDIRRSRIMIRLDIAKQLFAEELI